MKFVELTDCRRCDTVEEYLAWIQGLYLLSDSLVDYIEMFIPSGDFQRDSVSLLLDLARLLRVDADYCVDLLVKRPDVMASGSLSEAPEPAGEFEKKEDCSDV